MNITEVLGQLLNIFTRVNPDKVIKTPFQPDQNATLASLIEEVQNSPESPVAWSNLAKVYLYVLADGDRSMYGKAKLAVAKSQVVSPLIRSNILRTRDELVFKTVSVPGQTRLCRVPFYPVRDENSWSSRFLNLDTQTPQRQSFGIDELGDDPILAVGPWLSSADTTKVGPYSMVTRKVEYGAYRLIGLEIAANFGNRYLGVPEGGTEATGSVTIDGVPSTASGTIEAVGPIATPASGQLTVVGTGAEATGSVEFTGAPAPATGAVEVVTDGENAEIFMKMFSGEDEATATIRLLSDGLSGLSGVRFFDGDQASGSIRFTGATISDGQTIQMLNTGAGTGQPQVTELYIARTTPTPGQVPIEFQAGTITTAASSFVNAINNESTVFSATYSATLIRANITQIEPGTHGNAARGSNISTGIPSTIVQFSGGTDAYESGKTITFYDLLGNTHSLFSVDSGTGQTNGTNFTTAGRAQDVANNYQTSLNFQRIATPITDLNAPVVFSSSGGWQVSIGYSVNGYLPFVFVLDNSLINPPEIVDAPLRKGLDSLDPDTEILIEDWTGDVYSFAPQPNGTTAPPAVMRTAFQTYPDANQTAISLRDAINISGAAFTAQLTGNIGEIIVRQNSAGRKGNGLSLTYQTISGGPFQWTNPIRRPEADVLDMDATFAGGTSPVPSGTVLTFTKQDGVVYTFTGTDGAIPTASTFNTNGNMAETSASIDGAFAINGNFDYIRTTDTPPDEVIWRISQLEPGSNGNRTVSTTSTDLAFGDNAAGPFTSTKIDMVNGTDAIDAGYNFQLTDTAGVIRTFTFTTSVSSGYNIQVSGFANQTASEIQSVVDSHPDFIAVLNGGNPLQIDITQVQSGPAGNTTITTTAPIGQLVPTNFTGGQGVYPVGETVTLTDVDGVSQPFSAIEFGPESATEFVVNDSASDTASSLATAISIRSLKMTSNVVGNVLELTQDGIGIVGNTPINASSPANVNLVSFTGGGDYVTPGTTITVADTVPAIGLFTGVSGVPAANEFDTRGSVDDIATSIATQVTASFLSVNASSIGAVVTFNQNEVGTVGDGSALSSSNVGEIAETSTPFSGGVDNVSVGTTVTVIDSFGDTQVFTAVNSIINPNDFIIDNVNPAQTILNLAGAINAVPFDVTATPVGTTLTIDQNTNGPDGNTVLATSDNSEFQPTGFSGGTYSVELGSMISLTDTNGNTMDFTAVSGVPGANEYQVDPTVLGTLNNLKSAIDASGLDISSVVVSPTINLTQDQVGEGGNTPISIIGDPFNTLSSIDFIGGTNPTLNLVNDLSPIAFSIRDLTVYNGDNILIVEDSESVSAGSFNIMNRPETFQYSYEYPPGTTITPQGQPAAPMAVFKKEETYKFLGLRDQPIVDPNSQVFVKIEGFVAHLPEFNGAYPANTPLPKIPPVSLSINLIVDLLDDKIFGDPIAPSPASRPGANIKLGKIPVGENKIRITNRSMKK